MKRAFTMKSIKHKHRMSKLFLPLNINLNPSLRPQGKSSTNSDLVCKSQKIFMDYGLIQQSSTSGSYNILPLAFRSLNKMIDIVNNIMEEIGCQRLHMPLLTSSSLWKTTGRYELCKPELMILKDRIQREYILSPTHEEAICDLIGSFKLSHKALPLRLYQISEKFRDEMRPRFGLLRSRQFLMKDLYTFDMNELKAKETYELVNEAYTKFFNIIGVNWVKVNGDSGTIGGSLSHEYHLISDVGEDQLLLCKNCKSASSHEYLISQSQDSKNEIKNCINCNSSDIEIKNGIEIGHAFLLGKKYSQPLNINYVNKEGKLEQFHMGCFGLGLTRLLQGVVEVLMSNKQEKITWPLSIAPFLVVIVNPKTGSKEERLGKELSEKLEIILEKYFPNDDVLIDDRADQTIGKKISHLKSIGIPFHIILGKGILEDPPLIELYDSLKDSTNKFTIDQIANYFENYFEKEKEENVLRKEVI